MSVTFNRHIWEKGHIITANDLNRFEEGVVNLINESDSMSTKLGISSQNGPIGLHGNGALENADIKDANDNDKKDYLITAGALVDASNVSNGWVRLNASKIIPSELLPSYVDDVLVFEDYNHFPGVDSSTGEIISEVNTDSNPNDSHAPAGPEEGKIYIAADTGYTYRWYDKEVNNERECGYALIGVADLDYTDSNYPTTNPETTNWNKYYVKRVTQTDGKINVEHALFNPSITWTSAVSNVNNGKPSINISIAGNSSTVLIPDQASTSVYGITKLSNTIENEQTVAATPKAIYDLLGVSNGIATLDTNGHVPDSQVPSGVYTHATDANRLTTANTTSKLYKITTTNEGHIASATAATKTDLTDLGVADATDTVLMTTLSRGRKNQDTSIMAEASMAFGLNVDALGTASVSLGNETCAHGNNSIAVGDHTIAYGKNEHVRGQYNAKETTQIWQTSTNYTVGDIVSLNDFTYKCIQDHESTFLAFDMENWEENPTIFLDVVGNGTANSPSNAYALDTNGNVYLKGDLYVHCSADSSNGVKVATVEDTILNTTLSRGRAENTTVGTASFAFGDNVIASAAQAVAFGTSTEAQGINSVAIGELAIATGKNSIAIGESTTAAGECQHVIGMGNVIDNIENWETWQTGKAYQKGNKIKTSVTDVTTGETIVTGYICITNHTSSTSNTPGRLGTLWKQWDYMNYAEIVGNGMDLSGFLNTGITPSNARALDWDGNEYLAGSLHINCNSDSTGGMIIRGTSNNEIEFSDGTNSVTFTIAELNSLKGLLNS